MNPRSSLVLAAWLLAVCLALGHVDPRGNIYPRVSVENDQFIVAFNETDDDREKSAISRMVFTVNDSTVPPQLASSDRQVSVPTVGTVEVKSDIESVTAADGKEGWHLVLETTKGGQLKQTALPVKTEEKPWIASYWIDDGQIAVLWNIKTHSPDDPLTLKLSWMDRNELPSGVTSDVGWPAYIYHFPRVSKLVLAEGKLWFAWVRSEPDETKIDMFRWVTVLTSYDPKTKRMDHTALPQKSDWNTSLSMALCKGWLCIAWHCSKDGSYPGVAEIVTAFKRVVP
jgi:hypothetical protein